MNRKSEKERFYIEVGDAMFSNNIKGFINLETLDVEMYPEEELYGFEEKDEDEEHAKDENDPGAPEDEDNPISAPEKYFAIEQLNSRKSFEVMENFTQEVTHKQLQRQLVQALEGKKPFANFKNVIDNSLERQNWFTFRDEACSKIGKQWLERNAPSELKEK